MHKCQPKTTMDRAIALVASARRRRLLRYLSQEPDTVFDLGELAQVLHAEDGPGLDSLEVILAHHHLPKLADAGMVEYDHRSGAVRPTGAIEAMEPLLEACRELECALD